MRGHNIPLEQYEGAVPLPMAVYRPANVAGALALGFAGIPFAAIALLVGIQAQTAYPVGGPAVPQTQDRQPGAPVPFRRATMGRGQLIQVQGPTQLTTSSQPQTYQLEGSGYLYAIDLQAQGVVPSTNAATVAAQEDAPWSVFSSIILSDVNGELVNLDGFSLRLANMYCGYLPVNDTTSTDTSVYQNVTGSGVTGGNFNFHLLLPAGTNRRDLIGVLGNQDRAQRYTIRDDFAASTAVWSTAPSALPNVTVTSTYESFTVPSASNARGLKQVQVPDKFGVLHYLTKTVNPGSAPLGGATVNHYLARLGNTIRVLILVLRSNSSRATAETNAPTRITFLIGDVPIFTESPAYRRQLMFKRYGFDAPNGVYVYDAISDFMPPRAGAELGEDYYWTNGLVNAQFQITYPSGFGSTANTLTIITDDLQIPAGMNFYGA